MESNETPKNPTDLEGLRLAAMGLVFEQEVPTALGLQAFRQCHHVLRDIQRLQDLARELHLGLSGFRCDTPISADLALYFNLSYAGQNVAYISR